MTYGKYLREHSIWAIVIAFLVLTTETFLLLFPGSGGLKLYLLVAAVLGYFLGSYVEFRKEKRFFNKADEILGQMDKGYLFPEMLEKGHSQEEEQVSEILRTMERAMSEEVSDYRRKSEEYKEYIETWVHEVKIPIATGKMILTNHKEGLAGSGGKDWVNGLNEEIEKIEGYVEQALFYARSSEVEKDYFIKPVDLNQVVNDTICARKRTLIAKKASVDIHDLETETEVLSDGKWLTYIVGQIVDNAIKYSKEEKVSLEIYAEKDIVKEGKKTVALVIKDQGIGMKSSEVDRVFEKGFTGSNGRTGKASTGIGLYLCKKLCKRLEHEITLKSVLGEGTEVRIVF